MIIVCAVQGIKVTMKTANIRSRDRSMIRQPRQAGTLHPILSIQGMNAFPCKPIVCMKRSIMKAIRVM